MHYSCHFHIISELCACGYQPQGSHIFTPSVVNQTQNDNLQSKSHLLTHCDHRLPSTEIDFFNYTSIRQTRAQRVQLPPKSNGHNQTFMFYDFLLQHANVSLFWRHCGVVWWRIKKFSKCVAQLSQCPFKWYLTRYHFLVFFSRSRLTLLLIN